jgi:hypothetical protein
MGAAAPKVKAEQTLKAKPPTNIKIKSSNNTKNSSNSNKSLASSEQQRKFQSTGAVASFKNTLISSEKKTHENLLNSPKQGGQMKSSQELRNSRNFGNKIKAAIATKTKTQIDAASELDVLRIVKKNNNDILDYESIDNCLVKHFFMRCLEKDARMEIIKEMSLCKIDSETYVFKQDSMGSFFYIIKEGECELFINENYIKNIKVGESFGELALLHRAPRSGSVKTVGVTYVWCLEKRNFRKIVDHINYMNYEENKRFINSIPVFVNIDNDLKSILASNLIKEFYEKDKVIVKGNIILIFNNKNYKLFQKLSDF